MRVGGIYVCALLVVLCQSADSLDNGVADLPRMGWSSWNYFSDVINETLIHQQADALVETGLRDLGFTYLHLDAGALIINRTADGKLQINRTRFPSGMPALSAYIHSRGLKFGMYTDIGNASCGKGPGSYGHYAADATTFATEWQIDALKVDFCDFWFIPEQLKLWQQFRDALNATGRPIWLYTSPHSGGSMPVAAHGISAPWHGAHPYSPPPEWSAQTVRGLANSMMFQYVNLFDFWWSPHWGGATSPPGGLLTNIDGMNVLQERAGVPAYGSLSGAGFWADAQQLEVCNFGKGNEFAPAGVQLGMTLEEYRAHYTIWAMYASPMVLSADLTTIGSEQPECLAMVMNKEVVAIAQDSAGLPGKLVHQATNLSTSAPATAIRTWNIVEQVWARNVTDSGGGLIVCLFNRDESRRNMSLSWEELGLSALPRQRTVRDIWRAENVVVAGGVSAVVPKHSVVLLKINE